MRASLLVLFLFWNSQLLLSQSLVALKGTVVNTEGKTISGAHITLQNAAIGTATNAEGKFVLKIPKEGCNDSLLVSHISFETRILKVDCSQMAALNIQLTTNSFLLGEAVVEALSAEQIIAHAIDKLEKNYQVDSVNYTIFSRTTEKEQNRPVLLEEFVFDMYHDDRSKPEFYITKVRGKGFGKVGKKLFEEERLMEIHIRENYIMLRYLSNFLKKKKIKKFNYQLADERLADGEPCFVISVGEHDYIAGAEIWVTKEGFAIPYMRTEYKDEHWAQGSRLNTIRESFYKKDGNKWFFSHGNRSYISVDKKADLIFEHRSFTVVTNRGSSRNYHKSLEMGLMVQMLKDFKSSFEDDFWEEYNYIPLNSLFEKALLKEHTP